MGEVIDQVQHEFWQPPVRVAPDSVTSHDLSETCRHCAAEFIVGSRFCHSCGVARAGLNTAGLASLPGLAELAAAGERIGLTVAPFAAFLIGVICVVGAFAVGVIFSAKTFLDWQAIQLWRIEWLLGAVAAFAAGMLLKRSKSS